MNSQLIIGLVLTFLPIIELRGGLPVVVEYLMKNDLPIWPYFLVVVGLNILVFGFVFLFLDLLNERLMKFRFYEKSVGRWLGKVQKKADKLEKEMKSWGFIALAIFVAVPFPGTGAWTGSAIAWVLGLDRWKSFFAVAVGVLVAGLIVLAISLGFFGGLSYLIN